MIVLKEFMITHYTDFRMNTILIAAAIEYEIIGEGSQISTNQE